MSKFELVPIHEVDPQKTGEELFESARDDMTRLQLRLFLPGALTYGESLEVAQERIRANQQAAQSDSRFDPLVQTVDERAVGMASIDERLRATRCTICAIPLGEIAVLGPNTSSWISNPYQGQGFGRLSLEERIDRTKQAGHDGLWTVVDDENIRSMKNVEDRGFRRVHRGQVRVGGQKYKGATVSQYTH